MLYLQYNFTTYMKLNEMRREIIDKIVSYSRQTNQRYTTDELIDFIASSLEDLIHLNHKEIVMDIYNVPQIKRLLIKGNG